MHVIARRTLNEYAALYPRLKDELDTWFHAMKSGNWKNFNELHQDFPSADLVKGSGNRFIFNIKGNHYRLLVVLKFNTQRVYIRGIYTHAQYSKLTNKDLLRE